VVNETRLGYSRSRITNGLPELNFDVPGLGTTVLPQFNVAGYPQMGGAGGYTPGTSGGLALVRDNTYQLYDNISWTRGRHALKFGVSVDWTQYNRIETPNAVGSYQFTDGFTTRTARNDGTGDALATFLLGLPAVASRSMGPSRIDGRQRAWALYAQDTFRVSSRLTLNLGLRYEFSAPLSDARQQMASIDFRDVPMPRDIFAHGRTAFYKPTLFVCGVSGYPRGCAHSDRNNFAPRIGVAFEASPKTVLRAGAGVFYLNIDDNPLVRLAAGLPNNVSQTVNSDNFVPRFRNLDVFDTAVVGTAQVQAAAIDLRQRTGYSMEWTASVERQLGRLAVIEAGYVAVLGLKLEQSLQPNSALPGAGPVDARRPYAGLDFAPGTHFPDYVNVTTGSVPVGVINYLPHWAQSNYHAGFVRVERRFSGGLTLLNAYTWSKAISNAPQTRNAGAVTAGDNTLPQDSYNLRAERGLAAYHAAQRFVSTVVYNVPFGRGKRGGTQVAGIWSMQTGFPFSLGLRGDTAGIGAGQGAMYMRPNAVAGVRVDLPGSERTTERWLNAAAVSTPPAGTFGNMGRNTVIGPGLANLDLAISRFYARVERVRMEFRAEFFNALNHPNYNSVGRILNDPTFGRVLSQLDPRQVQLGLKVSF
jgi:TonB dependent receptor